MKKRRILLLLLAVMLLFAGSAHASKHKFYIRLDGISGSSKDAGHAGWIDVRYFSHSSAVDREHLGHIIFKHEVDIATPKIQQYCTDGTLIPNCELQVCDSSGKWSYSFILTDIRVVRTKIDTTEEDGRIVLEEEVELVSKTIRLVANEVPKTGDSALPLLWCLLAAASAAAVFPLLKQKRVRE